MVMTAYGSAMSRSATDEGRLDSHSGKEESKVPYAQQQRLPPWKWSDIRWGMGGYITAMHLLAFFGLTYTPVAKAATLWWAFLLWPITGFGITGGVHRLWSHRSYTAG